jgi:hypothetical protein
METFKRASDEMTYATDIKLIGLLHTQHENITHADLNTCTDEPENQWNIDLQFDDILTITAKGSSNGQLS